MRKKYGRRGNAWAIDKSISSNFLQSNAMQCGTVPSLRGEALENRSVVRAVKRNAYIVLGQWRCYLYEKEMVQLPTSKLQPIADGKDRTTSLCLAIILLLYVQFMRCGIHSALHNARRRITNIRKLPRQSLALCHYVIPRSVLFPC